MYIKKSQAFTRLILLIGIIVLINLLISTYYLRLDFTADKRYTLSPTTKEILKELEGPVTITAYFSSELPPDIKTLKDDFRDILSEYATYSGNKVRFVFTDPSKDRKLKEEVIRKGIQPLLVNIRKKDKFQQQEVFLGALVQYMEQSEAIPAIQPGAPMEFALSFAIKKCSTKDKPPIGFVQGHGEADRRDLLYVEEALSAVYNIEMIRLEDHGILDKYKAIAIVNPIDSFSDEELYKLEAYFMNGGNIFIAHSLVKGDLSQSPAMAYPNPVNLENWLSELGLRMRQNLVYDLNSAQITVQQMGGYYLQLQFPYIAYYSEFGKHPVTEGLEAVLLPFASEIEIVNPDTNIKITPLIVSSAQAGTHPAPLYFDLQKVWTDSDFNRFDIAVAVAYEMPVKDGNTSRLVLVSNGDFGLSDAQGRMQGTPDNLHFIAGAIDWLADESGLADLRSKSADFRPIKKINDKKKSMIKYTNVFLPVLIIIIIGILRYRWNIYRVRKWFNS